MCQTFYNFDSLYIMQWAVTNSWNIKGNWNVSRFVVMNIIHNVFFSLLENHREMSFLLRFSVTVFYVRKWGWKKCFEDNSNHTNSQKKNFLHCELKYVIQFFCKSRKIGVLLPLSLSTQNCINRFFLHLHEQKIFTNTSYCLLEKW